MSGPIPTFPGGEGHQCTALLSEMFPFNALFMLNVHDYYASRPFRTFKPQVYAVASLPFGEI